MKSFHWVFVLVIAVFPMTTVAQTASSPTSIGILTPSNKEEDALLLNSLRPELEKRFVVLEEGISRSALSSFDGLNPFNMSIMEGRNLSEAIGAEILLLLEASTQARTSLSAPTGHETFASIHLVSGRNGRLIAWRLFTRTDTTPESAMALLRNDVTDIAEWIERTVKGAAPDDAVFRLNGDSEHLQDFSDEGVKAPAPYRRISPGYTETARLYGREGIVEAEIHLDSQGVVVDVRLIRWIGYGLDESVVQAVREMSWRPAYRDDKPVSSRFLVRYNFTEKGD